MRVTFQYREKGSVEFGLIYGGILAIGLLVARFLPLTSVLPACAFRGMLGVPCPTCGVTRATMALAQGDIVQAISSNPLLSVLMISALLYGMCSAVLCVLSARRPQVMLDAGDGTKLRAIGAALVLANWGYLLGTL